MRESEPITCALRTRRPCGYLWMIANKSWVVRGWLCAGSWSAETLRKTSSGKTRMRENQPETWILLCPLLNKTVILKINQRRYLGDLTELAWVQVHFAEIVASFQREQEQTFSNGIKWLKRQGKKLHHMDSESDFEHYLKHFLNVFYNNHCSPAAGLQLPSAILSCDENFSLRQLVLAYFY